MELSEQARRVAAGAPEAQVYECELGPVDRAQLVAQWATWLRGKRLLDVGCGEGNALRAFAEAGYQIEGVELNTLLVARARERGISVHEEDAVSFVRREGERFEGFLLLDFIEHIPPEQAERLLVAIPAGATVVIQTPNTDSLAGHHFYLQVPSHVAPYSPAVLARFFQRTGFEPLATGSLYGGLPWRGLRRTLTEFLLVKLLGTVTTRLLAGGANYYVVARKR